MKLASLKALVSAVDEGSLRAAARRLGVSQPAMTKHMLELERELGAPLLHRSTAGVVPTAQGKVLLEHARRVMRELDEARVAVDQLGGRMIGELALGAAPVAMLTLVPETLRTFGKAYPEIQIHLREELFVGSLTLLRNGEVDIVIGPVPENLPPGEFEVQPLMPVEMVVVVARGSPLAKARSLRDLQTARWVYTSISARSGYASTLFLAHGLPPPVPAAIVNSTLALVTLLGQPGYVGLSPQPLVVHPVSQPFLSMVPIEEGPLRLMLAAIVRRSALHKPALGHFLAHLHRAATRR